MALYQSCFILNNAALYLNFMWLDHLLTKWFTIHCHLTSMGVHPNCHNHSTFDRIDHEPANDIVQFDNNIQSWQPQREIFSSTEALIGRLGVQSVEDEHWEPLAAFAKPQQWHVCHSTGDRNMVKLNSIASVNKDWFQLTWSQQSFARVGKSLQS